MGHRWDRWDSTGTSSANPLTFWRELAALTQFAFGRSYGRSTSCTLLKYAARWND